MRIAVPSKNQFNISLDPDLKKRLEELATEFDKGAATKVGAEIIKTYVERWAILERQIRQWRDEQNRQMMEDVGMQIRGEKPRLVKGAAQSNSTGRKKTK